MLRALIDCFSAVFNCTPGSDPQPAPEINAASGVAAIVLLLSIGAIVYRQMQQEQQ